MAERRTHPNGGTYERGADGQWHLVSGGPAIGPAIGNNPKLPLEMQGAAVGNANAGVNLRVNSATENAQIREANAKADTAESGAKTARVEGANPGFTREKELRSAFEAQPEVQAYRDAATSLGVMLQTPDTGGGDIQIIYNYIKSQGPGPVAQGELDLAQSVASFREGLEQKYGKLTSSNRLPARVRRELIEASRQAVAVKRAQFDQQYSRFRSDAVRNHLDPESVTGPHPADAIRPAEEKYIRQHGQTPHSSVTGQAVEVAAPNAKYATRDNPERSAFIDAMVRNGVPFERAQEAYRQQFPGVPVFDNRGKWNEALSFARNHPGVAGSFGQSLDTLPLNQTEQDRNWLGQTAPGQVATLYGNAAAGGIPSYLAGDEGQRTVEASRERLGNWGLIPEALGAVTGTLGANKALGAGVKALESVPYLRGPASFLANNPGKQAFTADLGYGATYGATQNPDNPGLGALLGASAAGGGNVVGRAVIAPGLRLTGRAMGLGAPALPAAEGMVASQAIKANPDDVLAQLNQASELNMPFTLADADPRLRALAGSTVRKSPDAYALANKALGSRPGGQADRMTTLIDSQLAPSGAIGDIVEGSLKRARAGSKDLYTKAMDAPAPDDAQLSEILRNPTMEAVARDAYNVALNKGESPASLSFETDSITGQPRLTANPNWRTLQYMKFELDKMAKKGGDGLPMLQRRFNARLSRLNSDFRAANKAYGDVARQGSTAQAGYDAAAPGVSPANLGLPKDNLPHFQQGYASRMADTAGQMRLRGDPYEAVYGSPWQQQKLGMVFPDNAPNFAKARGLEGEMSLTNRELFGGSPTQPRGEADKMFDAGGMMDVAQDVAALATGTPPINVMRSKLFAGRGMFKTLDERLKFGSANTAKQRADQLAPILFNQNPDETAALLADMIKRQAMRDAYVQKTGMFGSAIGAPTAISLTGR